MEDVIKRIKQAEKESEEIIKKAQEDASKIIQEALKKSKEILEEVQEKRKKLLSQVEDDAQKIAEQRIIELRSEFEKKAETIKKRADGNKNTALEFILSRF
ncbi:MAG: hypothetical protein ABIM21_01815 [candidate division WOR-3 bacterium]